ncbi:MAG: PLP-dependent aminotransferase family protein [Faecalibacterium sp.]|nr:PLP-dependent aminotransferase family protein [Ruminococcus sp.]MCM1393162.1 PLP-dependent aminotransferase family protein [Ruminococcus sp.]MCM1486156.1 PLP-dependent aminotransferase family protein [Faecalibacterium sp.]
MDKFVPKYVKLYEQYKSLILDGVLSSGEKIPSIRTSSQNFNLSRTTVETAYAMLEAEGYIISKAQSGFYVCKADFEKIAAIRNNDDADVKNQHKIKYDLVSSGADRESFNFALWRRYIKSALRQDERLLSYGEPQGEHDLREAICSYISKERNVICTPKQIVIAAGTQSLIGILCAITRERKEVVFVGSRFDGGKAVFEDYGKHVSAMLPIPKKMNELSNFDVSLIYTSPSHIDSWGSVLDIGKRREMLEFAHERDCLIIEDDYDSEFRYYTRPMPSLQGMDAGQNVVYIGTFSKMLLPSIRISFMVLPPKLVAEYEKRGRLYNQTASKAEQIALCQYIRDGHLGAQIKKQRKQYASKTKQICKRASEILPKTIEFSECHASYLIRIKARTQKSSEDIAETAEMLGVKIRPIGNENGRALLLISVAGFDTQNCDDMLELLVKAVYE